MQVTRQSRNSASTLPSGSGTHYFRPISKLCIWPIDCLSKAGGFHLTPRMRDVDYDVARDILRYFVRNPRAADTVEGVARWRLLDEKIHSNLEQVTRAIGWLVSRKLLVSESSPPSTSIFHLNQQAEKKIQNFLEARDKKQGPEERPRKKKNGKQRC